MMMMISIGCVVCTDRRILLFYYQPRTSELDPKHCDVHLLRHYECEIFYGITERSLQIDPLLFLSGRFQTLPSCTLLVEPSCSATNISFFFFSATSVLVLV